MKFSTDDKDRHLQRLAGKAKNPDQQGFGMVLIHRFCQKLDLKRLLQRHIPFSRSRFCD